MARRMLVRHHRVRRADMLDDQKDAADIALAESTSSTDERLQEYLLSQVALMIDATKTTVMRWHSNFSLAGIKSLKELTDCFNDLPVDRKVNVCLSGTKNGSNRDFTTPEVFVHEEDGDQIQIFHNGRLLKPTFVENPTNGDYFVSESGGSGTGFDTVTFLSLKPQECSELKSHYRTGVATGGTTPGSGSPISTGFYTIKSGAPVAVLDVVYLSAANEIDCASAADISTQPVIGVVRSIDAGVATVQYEGEIEGFSGMTPGNIQFLSKDTPGAIIEDTSAYDTDNIIQKIGFAKNPTTLVIQIDSDFVIL